MKRESGWATLDYLINVTVNVKLFPYQLHIKRIKPFMDHVRIFMRLWRGKAVAKYRGIRGTDEEISTRKVSQKKR